MTNSMLPSRYTANSSRDGRKIQGNTPSGLVGPEAPASNSIASLENRESSDVVIVLGMHRSGTSAVAGTLVKLGGGSPKHFMVANAGNSRGYFESVAFMQFHDELLASAGSRWHDWRLFNPGWYSSPVAAEYRRRAKELFEAEFSGAALPVIKDPRICRFAPFWLEVLREMQKTPRIVIPIRSPLEVAQSLEKQQGVPLNEGLLLWLRHNLDAEAQTRAEARSIFTFDEFQSDWRGVCDKISTDTNLFWPRLSDRTSREIDNFLTKDLVHHETDRAALATHSALHEWTLRAYDALLELARDPSSDSALDTLDEVRALLEQSSRMFGRILVDYEIALEDLRGESHALTSERDLLRARQSEILTESAAATAELAEATRDKDALSQSLAASVAERDALREECARMAAELQSRQQELEEKAAALAEFAARDELAEIALDEAESALDAAVRDQEALSQRLTASLAELAASRQSFGEVAQKHADALAALESERSEKAAIEAARADLAETLDRTMEEKRGLAAHLDHALSELQRVEGISSERASALGGQLVDAEAALSHAAA